VLGLVLYVPGLPFGAANVGMVARKQYPDTDADPAASGGYAFVCGALGVVIGYIVFWGLPAGIPGWALIVVLAFLSGVVAMNVAVRSMD
jgi:drug/metabolite transporter (DMT)-like permease